jgi:hypothetical protein
MRARLSLLSALFFLGSIPAPASAQAGGSVVFVGTEVLPLGGATLMTGAAIASGTAPLVSNRLYVGNLSFSGSDGFSVQIGGGSGALIGFMDTAPTFPVGGEISLEAKNVSGIVPCVRLVKSGAGMVTIDPDFASLGATSYRVEVWNDGEPVAWTDGVSGTLSAPVLPATFAIDLESVIAPLPESSLPATSAFALSDGFVLRWNAAVSIMAVAGGSLGTGDELRMYPLGTIPLGSVVTIDVTVAIPSAFPPFTMTVDDLAQQQFGRLHRGGGSATILCHTGGAPTRFAGVDALSSHNDISMNLAAGLAGSLQFDLHPSQSGDILIWDPMTGFVAGDVDEYSVTAELLTGGQGVVGKVTSLHTGPHWNVTPDFSGSGSPDARVELFDASGNLLGINPGVTQFSVMTNGWAIETDVEDEDDLALVLGFETPVPVDIGTGVITASRIKMHSNASRKHKFFAIVDRSTLRMAGGLLKVKVEKSDLKFMQEPGIVDFTSQGSAYGKRRYDSLLLGNMGNSGGDGVEIQPCILPGETPPAQFGIEWMPLGPPSANTGQTDWAFVSQLATDSAPVERLAIRLVSNGSVVSLSVIRQTPNTDFGSILKKGGATVSEFEYTELNTTIAELPDWPAAIGYQVLAYDDQPWSIWIDLGYEMDVVTIPPDPIARNSRAALPLTKADLIEVIAKNTVNPGPPDKAMLSGKFAGIPFIVLRDDRPTTSQVGPMAGIARSVLRPAYPNPFNPQTTLSFDLVAGGPVSLKIYAVDGSYVATVHAGVLRAGPHAYSWNGIDRRGQAASSGVYFAELRTPDGTLCTKLSLLK